MDSVHTQSVNARAPKEKIDILFSFQQQLFAVAAFCSASAVLAIPRACAQQRAYGWCSAYQSLQLCSGSEKKCKKGQLFFHPHFTYRVQGLVYSSGKFEQKYKYTNVILTDLSTYSNGESKQYVGNSAEEG